MPIINIYNPCKQELSKWLNELEEKRMAYLSAAEVAYQDEKAKRNYFIGRDKIFRKNHQFLYDGLARIESILEEIKNDPSLEHGKRLQRWLIELQKANELTQVGLQKNKDTEDGKNVLDRHKSFGQLINLLFKYVDPIVNQAEKAADLLECLKRLNASCQDFIEPHLEKSRANKRVIWKEASLFSYKKQKMENAAAQTSTTPPSLKRTNKKPAVSAGSAPTNRNPSTLFALSTRKRELLQSSEEDEISKNADLTARLESTMKYLHENYEMKRPEVYITLLEQITEGQKRVHHDVIDALIRLLLIKIKGIKGYENYVIRAKGYHTAYVCSLEAAEERVTPSAETATISLTPPL